MARRRLIWGIAAIAAVQIGGFIALVTTGKGIGMLGIIQWIGVYWVALALYRRSDLKQAGQQRATAAAPNPEHPAENDVVKMLEARIGNQEEVSRFSRFCQEHPALTDRLRGLADLSVVDGDFGTANAVLMLNNYAISLEEKGEFETAAKALQYSMAVQPENPTAWYTMAKMFWLQGRFEAAAVWAEKFLRFIPDPNASDFSHEVFRALETGERAQSVRQMMVEEMQVIKRSALHDTHFVASSVDELEKAIAEAAARMRSRSR